MNTFVKCITYYALIPFVASLPGFILDLCGHKYENFL